MPRVKVQLRELFTFEAIARAPEPPPESPAGMGVVFGKNFTKKGGGIVGF
jgi:hypothetical protein